MINGGSDKVETIHDSAMVDETVTVSKAEWQKLIDSLDALHLSQAELNQNQARLIAELARANGRVAELESKNAKLIAGIKSSDILAVNNEEKGRKSILNYKIKDNSGCSSIETGKGQAKDIDRAPRKTWAQIAAAPRPSLHDVTPQTQESLRKCMAMLEISSPEPKPTAAYFRNIKRARLGQVRKALKQILTHPWAVLGLSFIGKSVVEIVCHKALVDQVVAKLRLIGAVHVKNMNVFGDNLKKLAKKEGVNRNTLNLERAQQRFERLMKTCPNAAAKAWYSQQATEAERRLAEIYNLAHDVETSVSNDSGYESNEFPEIEGRASSIVETDVIESEGGDMEIEPAVPKAQVPKPNPKLYEKHDEEMNSNVGSETIKDSAQEAPPQH